MSVIIAGIIAAVVGVAVAFGGAMALTSSQGAGSFPEQAQGPVVVYGSN